MTDLLAILLEMRSGKVATDCNLLFGRLTAISLAPKRGRQLMVNCLCECGVRKEISIAALVSGSTKSCGCLRRSIGERTKTHGMTRSPEYAAWVSMIDRCVNPEHEYYADYGGRGISVCGEWMSSFEAFFAQLGSRPCGMTLERIDTNGNYEPGNCKWADWFVQANNRRSNRRIEFQGKNLTIAQWSREIGVSPGALWHRLKSGMPITSVLSTGDLRSA